MATELRLEYFARRLFEELAPGRELYFCLDRSVYTMEELLHIGYADPKVDSFHIKIGTFLRSAGWVLTNEGFDSKPNYRYIEYKRSEFNAVKVQKLKEPELVDQEGLRDINF